MADEKKDLRAVLDEAIRKRDELNVVIKFLQERMVGAGEVVNPEAANKPGGHSSIRPDASDPLSVVFPGMFFGKSQSQAVKELLDHVHRPIKTRMILDCLEKGGKKSGGKNPTTNLWTVLKRNEDVFIMVPKAGWGLCEWYDANVVAKYRKEPAKEGEKDDSSERNGNA